MRRDENPIQVRWPAKYNELPEEVFPPVKMSIASKGRAQMDEETRGNVLIKFGSEKRDRR